MQPGVSSQLPAKLLPLSPWWLSLITESYNKQKLSCFQPNHEEMVGNVHCLHIHMREQHSADIYNIFWAASFLTLAFVWARGSPSLQLSGDWREHLTSTANLSLQKCHTPCGCHWIVTVWHPRPLGWPCPCIYPGPCTEVRTVPSHVSRAEWNESRHHIKSN